MPDRSRAEPLHLRPGTRRRRRTSAGRRRTLGGPRCARGCGRRCDTSTPGATSYSFSNGRIWLWYSFKNRLPVRRSASGNPGGMETREKSGDSQNLASAAARWTRRSGRSRSLTPSTSSPPQWSMCRWVSTTSSRERIVRQVESGQTPEAERRVNRHLFVPGCDLPRLNLVRLLVDTNRAPLSRRPQRR
jgi:hypothetical protein